MKSRPCACLRFASPPKHAPPPADLSHPSLNALRHRQTSRIPAETHSATGRHPASRPKRDLCLRPANRNTTLQPSIRPRSEPLPRPGSLDFPRCNHTPLPIRFSYEMSSEPPMRPYAESEKDTKRRAKRKSTSRSTPPPPRPVRFPRNSILPFPASPPKMRPCNSPLPKQSFELRCT